MEKLASCRKFGGYPHEKASQFLAEFESYAILHNIMPDEDARKIAVLHLHLCGPALTWFNSLGSDKSFLAKFPTHIQTKVHRSRSKQPKFIA